jgi:hypothetical protein
MIDLAHKKYNAVQKNAVHKKQCRAPSISAFFAEWVGYRVADQKNLISNSRSDHGGWKQSGLLLQVTSAMNPLTC